MSRFAVRVRLDPAPEDRARLAAYPAADLWPDFAVVTAGLLAVDIGDRAVAYRAGRVVDLPAGAGDPAAWLPDYLGGFLPRLAGAVRSLRADNPTEAHLLDAPAGLAFAQQGEIIVVTWLDRGEPAHRAVLPLPALRAAVAATLATFLAELLAINPRLAAHPEVVALRAQHAALTTPTDGAGEQPEEGAASVPAWSPPTPSASSTRRPSASRWPPATSPGPSPVRDTTGSGITPGKITVFTSDHLDAAARLYLSVFNAPPWNDQWTLETAHRRLADTLNTPEALGLIALEGELMGFCIGYSEQWFDGKYFHLKELCVRTDRQRTGIGTHLLHHLEQMLHEMQIARLYLLTMRGSPAEEFYAKRGYSTNTNMILMSHDLDREEREHTS